MSVYLIFSFNVTDKERFAPYSRAVQPLLHRHQGEVIVADFNGKVLEGTGHQGNVVLRFPSEEHATAFYSDPEYQTLKQLRIDTTGDATLTMVNHFARPN